MGLPLVASGSLVRDIGAVPRGLETLLRLQDEGAGEAEVAKTVEGEAASMAAGSAGSAADMKTGRDGAGVDAGVWSWHLSPCF